MQSDLMTYHGLEDWYESIFEEAGWVILANAHGHHFKVLAYRQQILHLIKALKVKKANINDDDKIGELNIMINNVEYLLQFVNKGLEAAVRNAVANFENEIASGQAPLSPVISRLKIGRA